MMNLLSIDMPGLVRYTFYPPFFFIIFPKYPIA